ncbi:MAG: hypothetical protein K2O28_04930 [Clostridia bacterium]|nr:hypothetical protein [Clostridia bacterium]
MRKLTVRRRNAAICHSRKIKIYVEDPTGDTTIAGFKCRLLGEVENGSRATFEIPCERVRIFAIFGKLNKNYRNDYFIVPEGEEDYLVLGYCKYDKEAGKAFRFEGVTDDEVLANRQKCAERGRQVFMASLIVPLCVLILIIGAIGITIALLT